MGACKNLVGKYFGELKVIKKSEKRASNGGVYWICQCSCGTVKEILGQSLKSGKTISCGHIGKENLKIGQGLNFQNLIGQQFGMLTVIAREHNKKGKIFWKCKCSCGNETVVMADNLRNGNTQSCGFCNESSHGNIKIKKILDENNIPYEREKRFDDCKDILPLPFDFFVNDKYLIEFDGKQHYQHDLLYSNEKIQNHDEIKSKWCKDNNINLIRIPFTHYNDLCLEDLLLEKSSFVEK